MGAHNAEDVELEDVTLIVVVEEEIVVIVEHEVCFVEEAEYEAVLLEQGFADELVPSDAFLGVEGLEAAAFGNVGSNAKGADFERGEIVGGADEVVE